MSMSAWQRKLLKQNAGKLAELDMADFQEVLGSLFPVMTVAQLRQVDRFLIQETLRRERPQHG